MRAWAKLSLTALILPLFAIYALYHHRTDTHHGKVVYSGDDSHRRRGGELSGIKEATGFSVTETPHFTTATHNIIATTPASTTSSEDRHSQSNPHQRHGSLYKDTSGQLDLTVKHGLDGSMFRHTRPTPGLPQNNGQEGSRDPAREQLPAGLSSEDSLVFRSALVREMQSEAALATRGVCLRHFNACILLSLYHIRTERTSDRWRFGHRKSVVWSPKVRLLSHRTHQLWSHLRAVVC